MQQTRIKVAQTVMNKAHALGLDEHESNLAKLLKKMARGSAIASGNFNDQRRRYGSFILTIRDNTVVDLNCNEDEPCLTCLGLGFVGTEMLDCRDCEEY